MCAESVVKGAPVALLLSSPRSGLHCLCALNLLTATCCTALPDKGARRVWSARRNKAGAPKIGRTTSERAGLMGSSWRKLGPIQAAIGADRPGGEPPTRVT